MPSKFTSRDSSKSDSSKSASTTSETDLQEIDALFEHAGLLRHRHKKPAGVAGRASFKQAVPKELSPPPAECRLALNGVEWLPVRAWEKIGWLWHGFSTRRGGVSECNGAEGTAADLNLGFTPDDSRENVQRNRQLLVEAVTGSSTTPLITLRQIHSNVLALAGDGGTGPCKGDGLMTGKAGLLIGIQTADCIPVLVADKKHRAVAAFHAGWRGTAKRIVEMGIGRMRIEFGSRPEDMVAAIGPGIGPCCYAVGDEVRSEFESQFSYWSDLFREVYDTDPVRTKYPMLFLTQRAPGHSAMGPSLHVDLIESNRRQLLAAGLQPASIQIVGGCTSCQPEMFFSHRASKGRSGRMLSVIGIRGS